jgi:hypothetical protein
VSHLSAVELMRFADGALEAFDQTRAAEHLSDCLACQEALGELERLGELVRQAGVEPPAGYFEALPERILARIAESEARSEAGHGDEGVATRAEVLPFPMRRPRLIRWALASAAAVFVAVLAPWTLRRSQEERTSRNETLHLEATKPERGRFAEAPVSGGSAPAQEAHASPAAAPNAKGRTEPQPQAPVVVGLADSSILGDDRPEREAESGTGADVSSGLSASVEERKRQEGRLSESRPLQRPPASETEALAKASDEPDLGAGDSASRNEGSPKEKGTGGAAAPASLPAVIGAVAPPPAPPSASAPKQTLPRGSARPGLQGGGGEEQAASVVRQRARRLEQLAQTASDPREADEARVASIEAWKEAWEIGAVASDRETALDAGRAYLARVDARQPARVWRVLRALGVRE